MMTLLLGIVMVVAGIGMWLLTVKQYLDDPGYGGFDMNTAPAFDYGWFKGTVSLSVGVGLVTHAWAVGVGSFVIGFLSVMLVKPVLGSLVARRIKRASAEAEGGDLAKGFKALSAAERALKDEDGNTELEEREKSEW